MVRGGVDGLDGCGNVLGLRALRATGYGAKGYSQEQREHILHSFLLSDYFTSLPMHLLGFTIVFISLPIFSVTNLSSRLLLAGANGSFTGCGGEIEFDRRRNVETWYCMKIMPLPPESGGNCVRPAPVLSTKVMVMRRSTLSSAD
jgi:hypothetical protein